MIVMDSSIKNFQYNFDHIETLILLSKVYFRFRGKKVNHIDEAQVNKATTRICHPCFPK